MSAVDLNTLRADVKVVVFGDHGVGKTTLLKKMAPDVTPFEDAQLGVTVYQVTRKVDDKDVSATIWEVAAGKPQDPVDRIVMRDIDVAVILFDGAQKDTYRDAEEWSRVVSRNDKKTAIIVVGNKMDLVPNAGRNNWLWPAVQGYAAYFISANAEGPAKPLEEAVTVGWTNKKK